MIDEEDINDPEFYFQDNFDIDNDDLRFLDSKRRYARRHYHKHKKEIIATPEYKYKLLQKHSKKRKMDLAITKKEYLKFLEDNPKCYYCSNVFPCTRLGGYQLDRIDNSKGYYLNNIVRCCFTCNTMRNNHYSVDEFKFIVNYLID